MQAYPDGVPTRVSPNGGDEPAWSRDGWELFYREGTRMTTVGVRAAAGRTFTFDPATVLFDGLASSGGGTDAPSAAGTYGVGPDDRFLMRQPTAAKQRAAAGDIVVVKNWLGELRRLAPVK